VFWLSCMSPVARRLDLGTAEPGASGSSLSPERLRVLLVRHRFRRWSEERKYPIEDKAHARKEKVRAAQQEKAGDLSASDRKKVDAKADKVRGKG